MSEGIPYLKCSRVHYALSSLWLGRQVCKEGLQAEELCELNIIIHG